jgi:NADPH:quinone reductase-like Zn-dependent oxidoreductase
MKAVRVHGFGAPKVIRLDDIPKAEAHRRGKIVIKVAD